MSRNPRPVSDYIRRHMVENTGVWSFPESAAARMKAAEAFLCKPIIEHIEDARELAFAAKDKSIQDAIREELWNGPFRTGGIDCNLADTITNRSSPEDVASTLAIGRILYGAATQVSDRIDDFFMAGYLERPLIEWFQHPRQAELDGLTPEEVLKHPSSVAHRDVFKLALRDVLSSKKGRVRYSVVFPEPASLQEKIGECLPKDLSQPQRVDKLLDKIQKFSTPRQQHVYGTLETMVDILRAAYGDRTQGEGAERRTIVSALLETPIPGLFPDRGACSPVEALRHLRESDLGLADSSLQEYTRATYGFSREFLRKTIDDLSDVCFSRKRDRNPISHQKV